MKDDDNMKKRNLLIIGIVISILLISIIGIYFVIKNNFNFKLIGNEQINISVGTNYEELGYEARYLRKDITNEVKVESNLDITKLGEYEIKYEIKKWFVSKKLTRKIIVEDLEKPVITLKGENKITIYKDSEFNDPGYSANDNYDGNITDKVEVENNLDISKVGTYEIKYKVKDSSNNEFVVTRTVEVKEKPVVGNSSKFYTNIKEGPTYIKGILIVNKNYSLPSSFGGSNSDANAALEKLQTAGRLEGFSLKLVSGYRSYSTQKSIYNSYLNRWGREYTDTVSARPGHSEHQTGLAFDVGELSSNYGNTKEGIWLRENCHKYGFIIRYLKGKEDITGYAYEPWHIRHVGVEVATEIMNKNITLEEYLGIA